MAEVVTEIYVEKAKKEDFEKWFEKKTDSGAYFFESGNSGFHTEIDGGWGGFFWESLSVQMALEFEGIIFDGTNMLIWDDHIVRTYFSSDGKKVTLSRSIELSEYFDEDCEEDDMDEDNGFLALLEVENDIPYDETFEIKKLINLAEAYKEVKGKLKDTALVKNVCEDKKITLDELKKFINIFEWKKRK
jgi:hypothetical protein